MHVSARGVTDFEVPVVCDLAEAMRAELSPNRGGGVWQRREATVLGPGTIRHAATADGWVLLGGCIDEVVVGFAMAEREHLDDGSVLGRCHALYVDPGAREVGVGEALLDAVMDVARSWGATGVDSLVLPGDRSAKNFFEAAGMVARAIVVHRSLEP